MTIVVGIDPSYTGFALVALDGETIVDRVVIVTKPDPCRPRRLNTIRSKCLTFLDGTQPSLVAIEGYAHGAKFGREMAGGLGEFIRHALWSNGYDYVDVQPHTLKKYVTGKGSGKKEMMLREVYRRWNFDAVDNNDADAYGLARLAQAFAADATTWTKAFGEIVKKMELVKGANFGLRSVQEVPHVQVEADPQRIPPPRRARRRLAVP